MKYYMSVFDVDQIVSNLEAHSNAIAAQFNDRYHELRFTKPVEERTDASDKHVIVIDVPGASVDSLSVTKVSMTIGCKTFDDILCITYDRLINGEKKLIELHVKCAARDIVDWTTSQAMLSNGVLTIVSDYKSNKKKLTIPVT